MAKSRKRMEENPHIVVVNRMQLIKKALIKAMEQTLGIVTQACRIVGVSRNTYYDYYNQDPEFRKECDSIQELALDFAELALQKKIMHGDTTAIIFYLKTKGRKRGYIEKYEANITNLGLDQILKDLTK